MKTTYSIRGTNKLLYAVGLILFCLSCKVNSYGQNVCIAASATAPLPSAMLDIESTSMGFLAPRMTNAQKTAIAGPATGLLVYCTDAPTGFWYYNGVAWAQIGGSGWGLTGNTGTTASTAAIGSAANNNFIGTTDSKDWVIATNNLERMRISAAGLIGINNIAPSNCSILDMSAVTTLGLLIPHVSLTNTTIQTIAGTVVDGVLVYNTNAGIAGTGASGTGYYYWTTSVNRWINLVDNLPPGSPWFVIGNTGITQPATPGTYGTSTIGAAENFVGNTDANDLVFGTNDIERMRIKTTASGVGTSIGIGTATPDASAIVDETSTTKGLLIPRVALTATNAAAPITSPATSLLVYNTANAGSSPNTVSPGYYYWNGSNWVKFGTQGSSSFQYENRFQTNGTCGSTIYYFNSSNYGPGTYGDETNPYRNDYASGAYSLPSGAYTTPATIPSYYGVWYVSYTATAAANFSGYNGWVMIENNYNGTVTGLSGGAPFTVTIYFYKYHPTGGIADLSGVLCGSGTASISNTFTPASISFYCAPVAMAPGDIIIGYATISGCPWIHSTSYYSIIDVMGAMQF